MATNKQMTAKLVGLVLALVIGAILIGNVLPVGINSVEGNQTTANITSDVGSEVVVVDQKINATVDSVTVSTTDTATITLKDVESGNTVQHTVDNGTTQTYALAGGDVYLTLQSIDDTPTPSTATYQVAYPADYGWDDSSSAIWDLLPIFLVLAALVALAGIAMRQM